MKYKIIIINHAGKAAPQIHSIDSENRFVYATSKLTNMLDEQWENGEGWFALNLYGVHIFETDDLDTFDLLEAQREKDGIEKANKFLADFQEIEDNLKINKDTRKAEIRRIAEKQYVIMCMSLADSLVMARDFVDNFDAEFEKLEKGE